MRTVEVSIKSPNCIGVVWIVSISISEQLFWIGVSSSRLQLDEKVLLRCDPILLTDGIVNNNPSICF